MEEYKVLITTSGLGSRLGKLTNYTNKSLVRISDKPAISHIIESYPSNTNFIITLGHYGSHVKQFLELAYPNYNFTFVEIDKYKGEGSSLGYSISKCKDFINSPFIFHASDTIIKDYKLNSVDKNWIIGCYKEDNSQYRTLNINSGKIKLINEKGEIGYDFSYTGICGIKDFELFFLELEKLIIDNSDISDAHVINKMLSKVEFEYKQAEYGSWFDVGNTSELIKTRKFFENEVAILDKKDESIFFFDDCVIKFFADSTVNKNRVIRAKNLNGLVPNIIDYSDNFYKYKKAEGQLFSKSVNKQKFIKFINWTNKNLWIKKTDNSFEEKCYDFYIEKTKKRIQKFLDFNTDSSEYINGELIPPVYDLLDRIDSKWLCNGIPSQFHGDFILDNIIETKDGFCLIDWRQDFAGNLEVGDLYYDLAKLNHNLTINHDIVNKNLFDHSKENCHILVNSKLNECRSLLHSFILENGYDLRKVETLTSIIWINMAPLHDYPFNNFLFNFGKYNLYKNI